MASIVFKGKETYLGTFQSKEEAIEARQKKAVELHKEFAVFDG